MEEKYKEVLKEVLSNLRSIEAPNPGDCYIDDSIKIIHEVLKEAVNG
ncbi:MULTISPECIES: hypothetical protein [Clostridium]|uniref:Uncharacterized protein n=1 Tax=Clostridium faecium TaxID=2762223 RepID=A0ABR8YRA6_9CLOT|nr:MULTISPECIES: hypothetical protein [Clostridium]MBD8046785.1 hypothetical protein [Clostridium faecium]